MMTLSTGEDMLNALAEIGQQAKAQGRSFLAHLVEMAALELSSELKAEFLPQQKATFDPQENAMAEVDRCWPSGNTATPHER